MSGSLTPVQRALALAKLGWPVFPTSDKRPLVPWDTEATTDPEKIATWFNLDFAGSPGLGVGVHCGKAGLLAVDVDEKNGVSGSANLAAGGYELPPTLTYKTPSGGSHYLYRTPAGEALTVKAGAPVAGVDLRAGTGLIVFYGDPEDLTLAKAPRWAIEAARKGSTYTGQTGGFGDFLKADRTPLDSDGKALVARLCTKPEIGHAEMLEDQLAIRNLGSGWREAVEAYRAHYLRGEWDTAKYREGFDKAIDGLAPPIGVLKPTLAEAREAFGVAAPTHAPPLSSWDDTPFDDILDEIAAGTLELPKPTVGAITGTDTGLFYLGRVNGLAGESGSGKGWIAFATAIEQMKLGRDFYYLDFEDSAALAMLRLVNGFGVDPALLRERMHYIHPREHKLTEIDAFVARVRSTPDAFVVIDSTGESIGQSGRAQNVDEEVASWFQELAHPLSEAGATVLLIDHLVKSPDGGLWPSGSQRKRAAITGTQLIVEVRDAPSKDADGLLILKVAKDRHGARSAGSAASFARFTHEPFTGQLEVAFDPGKSAEQMKTERAEKAAIEAAAKLDADVLELQRLAPPPSTRRDIETRLGWGSTRAMSALQEYRKRVAS